MPATITTILSFVWLIENEIAHLDVVTHPPPRGHIGGLDRVINDSVGSVYLPKVTTTPRPSRSAVAIKDKGLSITNTGWPEINPTRSGHPILAPAEHTYNDLNDSAL